MPPYCPPWWVRPLAWARRSSAYPSGGLRALEGYAASGNESRERRAAAIRRLARRMRLATEQANEPARRKRSLAQTGLPSLDPPVRYRPAHRRRSGRHLGPPPPVGHPTTRNSPPTQASLPLRPPQPGSSSIGSTAMANGNSTRSCTGPPSHKASESMIAPEALCAFKGHIVRAIWRLRGAEPTRRCDRW
jgi:hypothetical protein